MFDLISGLPVHPLVVHGVVVLLPLMAVLSVVVAARTSWRRFAIWAVAGNTVVLALSFAASQSGEALRNRLGGTVAEAHEEWGEKIPLVAFVLLAASVVVWFVRNRSNALRALATGLVVVVALVALGLVVITGDTGARSVWESKVANAQAHVGDDDD